MKPQNKEEILKEARGKNKEKENVKNYSGVLIENYERKKIK